MKCRILDLHQNVERLAEEVYSDSWKMDIWTYRECLKEVENFIYYILEIGIHYGVNVILGIRAILQSYEYINVWFDHNLNDFVFELYNIKRIESQGSIMVYPINCTSLIINHKYI